MIVLPSYYISGESDGRLRVERSLGPARRRASRRERAEARAEVLLRSLLSPADQAVWDKYEYVDVPSRRYHGHYRISFGELWLRTRSPKARRSGFRSVYLCIEIDRDEDYPWHDWVAALVMMARYDEAKLLAIANADDSLPRIGSVCWRGGV